MTNRVGGRTRAQRNHQSGHKPSSGAGGHTAARHLFESWPQVVSSIQSARRVALFLDFDGTLAELRPHPGDVGPLDPALRRVLRRLAEHERFSIFVISGRTLAELRRLVPVPGVRLLGLHGWEGRDVPSLRAERQLLQRAKRLLDQRLADTPEVWAEDKGLGLAVHYRGAPQRAVQKARAVVRDVLGTLGPPIQLIRGHKVWEFLPRQISGKGSAVSALLSQLPGPTLAIFVGDDTTDESAFKVLRRGLTIHVGTNHRTVARFFLRDPKEVKMFLLRLGSEADLA